MEQDHKNFFDVLNKAQTLGYADTIPSSDLNGDDVAANLKILSSLLLLIGFHLIA